MFSLCDATRIEVWHWPQGDESIQARRVGREGYDRGGIAVPSVVFLLVIGCVGLLCRDSSGSFVIPGSSFNLETAADA